jgi:hypothetical protein
MAVLADTKFSGPPNQCIRLTRFVGHAWPFWMPHIIKSTPSSPAAMRPDPSSLQTLLFLLQPCPDPFIGPSCRLLSAQTLRPQTSLLIFHRCGFRQVQQRKAGQIWPEWYFEALWDGSDGARDTAAEPFVLTPEQRDRAPSRHGSIVEDTPMVAFGCVIAVEGGVISHMRPWALHCLTLQSTRHSIWQKQLNSCYLSQR